MVAAGLSDGEWPRAVAEVGWRTGDEMPDSMAVMSGWSDTRRPLSVLGGIEGIGAWRASESVLTAFGEATLTERLRAAATGPRSRPW